MIGPHPPNLNHPHDGAGRRGRRGDDRPAPRGSTVWWTVRAVVVVAAMVLGCVGWAGVMEATSAHCYGVSKRMCLSLVVDHLTGSTPPLSPSAD
ncbi:hypothetical protein [Actinoplanes sp. M2I2]|uniref:hypothetical protein n=1 Tax=Actinoplanes sp. M2I2 TaxID=1734444 RepID=UPI00202133A1|nr:hypothetical protein [Actinoplanes sp. M2I2]